MAVNFAKLPKLPRRNELIGSQWMSRVLARFQAKTGYLLRHKGARRDG